MDDLNQTIKAGQFLVIETGEYSDRCSCEPVRVVRDFVKGDVAKLFVKTFKPEYQGNKPSPDDFLPWLVKERYVEDVEDVEGVHNWHVGSYGNFEP